MLTKSRLYHVTRLWVELTRQLHRTVAPEMQHQFGSRIGLLLIGAAVYISTVEGRPMTASGLAAFVGMPRATLIRRLARLRRLGIVDKVGGTYRTTAKRLDQLSRNDQAAPLVRLVRATHEKLR
ncbi:helix-turn-helix domain-containing protein [Bradyrhizobium sp. CCBAU 51753]|uniref:helix-turn-helix domain-containing protein n=1 Tax=Bradyrhizobium sp. CCBAU 51753 TaxID=1325100 RepID=UPI00188D84F3|nr:ArsR family transcriptional regulator [Bradyrhizobium sp. CCBAU 51753]QOZ25263.1 hypothetical protein XH93_17965 [Bradyrhizobium sp. CCBAU 51753]